MNRRGINIKCIILGINKKILGTDCSTHNAFYRRVGKQKEEGKKMQLSISKCKRAG